MTHAIRSRFDNNAQRFAHGQPAARRGELPAQSGTQADLLAQSPRMVAQRHALSMAFGTTAQRKLSKRWKNVLSLGIRKAYVEIKRAVRTPPAGGVMPVVPQPLVSDEDRFVEAYGKSRYYHHSWNPENLPSIEKHGLLNQQDRIDTFGKDVVGMSTRMRDSEFKGDEKKGVFLGPRRLVEENRATLPGNFARAFMPSERTKISGPDEEHTVDPQEMFIDRNFPGGAVITKNSVGPELVTTEDMLDLLDRDSPKINTILASVATQYDGDPADRPTIEEMKQLLRTAIRERRLSNAALDNFDPT